MEAADLAAAEAFSAADPYTLAGLFESVDIRPWKVTFGALA
ncbi:MAG TPA: YciI family protein [Caulobacteraceae bacterium]|nr:YciI family protein [Caulobacteraceae bacterium]